MKRSRPVETLLAALATVSVCLPLLTLFLPHSFFKPLLLVVAAVAVSGMLLRGVGAPKTIVILGQVVAAFGLIVGVKGRGHLWYGLPSPDLLDSWGGLLAGALRTIQTNSAPAPATRGVELGILLIVAVLAIVVDGLAVTRRSPAVAGLALLTAFLVSAANSSPALPLRYFVLAAAAWLALVGQQGMSGLRAWGHYVPLDRPESGVSNRLVIARSRSAGRSLGIAALAVAALLPIITPHLPPRYFMSGLSRAEDGVGRGGGVGRLSNTLDVTASLGARSTADVLTYRTQGSGGEPLRVDALTQYSDGQWLPSDDFATNDSLTNPPVGMSPDVRTTTVRMQVTKNRIDPPQLAAPSPVVAADLGTTSWTVSANGSIRPQSRVTDYTIEYVRAAPTEEQLQNAAGGEVSAGFDDLAIDPESMAALSPLLSRINEQATSSIDRARALQAYLRGPDFSYSLTLDPSIAEDEGSALRTFLRTKKGYCVQYASTMALAARGLGIPARVAIGFLPGHLDGDGVWTVVGTDAHAWPELYFVDIGWLRFEPTPGGRSGSAPGYSSAPVSTSTASAGPSGTAGAATSSGPRTIDNQQGDLGELGQPAAKTVFESISNAPRWVWVVAILVLGLLGSLALPLVAVVHRTRRRRSSGDEGAEVAWAQLMTQVGDLGIRPPPGATPRQIGRYLATSTRITGPPLEDLTQVVDTLEKSRYARGGSTLTAPYREVATIVSAVSETRPWRVRLRALLWPSDGRQAVTDGVDRALAPFAAAWQRGLDRLRQGIRRDRQSR